MKMLEDEIIKVLIADKGWHSFLSFLPLANEKIPQELAVRYYKVNHGNQEKELEDKIRCGKRRILAETFRDLHKKQVIDCRDPVKPNDQDTREYCLLGNYVPQEPKVKAPKESKKQKISDKPKKPLEEVVRCIESAQDMVKGNIDNSQTKDDIIGLFRLIKRLVIDISSGDSTPFVPRITTTSSIVHEIKSIEVGRETSE